jgi:hypothetical protein
MAGNATPIAGDAVSCRKLELLRVILKCWRHVPRGMVKVGGHPAAGVGQEGVGGGEGRLTSAEM